MKTSKTITGYTN